MSEQNIKTLGKRPVKAIMSLSMPSIAEQFLVSLSSLIDTAMVGSIGAAATAGVGLNISTIWLVEGLITAASAGCMFLVARKIGEEKPVAAKRVARQSVTISIVLGFILSLITFSISGFIPYWLGASPEIIPSSTAYMKVYSLAFMFQSISVIVSSIFRAAGNTKSPFLINTVANIANIIGNFLLIYPSRAIAGFNIYGAGMGVRGAAISTLISKMIAAVLLITLVTKLESPIKISVKGDYRVPLKDLKKFLVIGIPVAAERSAVCIGQIVLTGIVTRIGTAALAAHYLANNIESLLYLPAYGFASTATTLVGQSMGARDFDLADRFAKLILIINCIFIVAICTPLFILSPQIVSLFSPDPDVISIGIISFRVNAATELFFTISTVASGICRGAGDVKFMLWVNMGCMWIARLLTSYILAFPLGLGMMGIWIGMSIDISMRALLSLLRIRSGKWKYVVV
ncbi:MAG: MATE family efflux transporter [Firmicutes bacterium]|nr:MATE family efflux transporter [Bacillota bacterium]